MDKFRKICSTLIRLLDRSFYFNANIHNTLLIFIYIKSVSVMIPNNHANNTNLFKENESNTNTQFPTNKIENESGQLSWKFNFFVSRL